MSMAFTSDARRLPPTISGEARARDISITDFAWATGPAIYRNTYVLQTYPCLKGASNSNVCRTSEHRSNRT